MEGGGYNQGGGLAWKLLHLVVESTTQSWLWEYWRLSKCLAIGSFHFGWGADTVYRLLEGYCYLYFLRHSYNKLADYNKSLSDELWFLCSTFLVGSSKCILNLMPFGLTEFQMLLPEIRFAVILLFEQDTRSNSSEFSFFLIYSGTLWCCYPTPHTLYL